MNQSLSVAIVTYNREQVLVDTIRFILDQTESCSGFGEIIVVDQTKTHTMEVQEKLDEWSLNGNIRWIKLEEPNLTGAMNCALLESKSDITLFVDDDIIPKPQLLIKHIGAHVAHPEVAVVVGQILQPGEQPQDIEYQPNGSHLNRYADFPFRSIRSTYIENAMAGNMSVKTAQVAQIGGFDENFTPPVASRFESEFAKRIIEHGGKIWFEASASLHHLAAKSGGTRTQGNHLTTSSGIFAVGSYYYALRRGKGLERIIYCLKKPLREIRTKFHLRNPWYIPVTLIAETRGFIDALRLYRSKPKLIGSSD